MYRHPYIRMAAAGAAAGAVTGLFGAGGGMVLIPLLVMALEKHNPVRAKYRESPIQK